MLFREARPDDLPAILALLADGSLEPVHDSADDNGDAYRRAFADIAADPRNLLLVAEDDSEVVACLQLTYIPGLTRRGTERALIEAVRVRADRRSAGLGTQFLTWVIELARERRCALVQLTTNKSRTDAHRFYQRLGFVASHEGMKLPLR